VLAASHMLNAGSSVAIDTSCTVGSGKEENDK